MGIFFYHNGKFFKAGTPAVGINSRGLRYGDGLFETIKLLNGNLVHADEHFARLWQGMQVLGFEVPRHFTPDVLEGSIKELAAKNGHTTAARVRLVVYRGEGGLYDIKSNTPNWIIETMPLPVGNATWNSNGLVMGIYNDALKICDITSGLKHNNYLPYLLAAMHAKKEKWNDAVLLNMHGRICDSTIANIFFVKNEVIYTPALSEGCVAGIMRRQLLALLRSHGWTVEEGQVARQQLLEADEVFLTNAIYNIRWVNRIDDVEYGNALTQKIYCLLQ
jgi:branched-chain amino acid aminotransferase